MAAPLLMPDGWFARFAWPDWPKERAEAVAKEVEEFHRTHPELRPVRSGSSEWTSVSCGNEADYESAEVIANAFNKHFGGRVRWVESEKDNRGRISADCLVEGAGELNFKLSWKYSFILPTGTLEDDILHAFRQAGKEVMDWASSRIQPILATLKSKLKELYGDRFRGLYVFGSYAKPDAGIQLPEDSDLDVAVLLSEMESSYKEIEATSEIVSSLSLEHGLVISLVHLKEADFREGQTNFTRVISEYAIPVL